MGPRTMGEQLKQILIQLGFIDEGGTFSHICENNRMILKAVSQNCGFSFQLTDPNGDILYTTVIVSSPEDIAKALIQLIDRIP